MELSFSTEIWNFGEVVEELDLCDNVEGKLKWSHVTLFCLPFFSNSFLIFTPYLYTDINANITDFWNSNDCCTNAIFLLHFHCLCISAVNQHDKSGNWKDYIMNNISGFFCIHKCFEMVCSCTKYEHAMIKLC